EGIRGGHALCLRLSISDCCALAGSGVRLAYGTDGDIAPPMKVLHLSSLRMCVLHMSVRLGIARASTRHHEKTWDRPMTEVDTAKATTILLVDDEPEMPDLLTLWLR